MTAKELHYLFDTLRQGSNPLTGEVAAPDSYLLKDAFQGWLGGMLRQLERDAGLRRGQKEPGAALRKLIQDEELTNWTDDLLRLDYRVTADQLAKVLLGSKTVVAPGLLALPWFGKFRGLVTRRALRDRLTDYARRFPGVLAGQPRRRVGTLRNDHPWREVSFFEDAAFDKLEDDKATELFRAVEALGLQRPTDKLPDYMARTRDDAPRSYEPWAREEQALLVEAMCYTNNLAKLSDLFGRSQNSLRTMGQRLIWESKQRAA